LSINGSLGGWDKISVSYFFGQWWRPNRLSARLQAHLTHPMAHI